MGRRRLTLLEASEAGERWERRRGNGGRVNRAVFVFTVEFTLPAFSVQGTLFFQMLVA